MKLKIFFDESLTDSFSIHFFLGRIVGTLGSEINVGSGINVGVGRF